VPTEEPVDVPASLQEDELGSEPKDEEK